RRSFGVRRLTRGTASPFGPPVSAADLGADRQFRLTARAFHLTMCVCETKDEFDWQSAARASSEWQPVSTLNFSPGVENILWPPDKISRASTAMNMLYTLARRVSRTVGRDSALVRAARPCVERLLRW